MPSMDIMRFAAAATAIFIFFNTIFPPVLTYAFFTCLILTTAITAATTAAETAEPAQQISTRPVPRRKTSSTVRYLRLISSGGGGSVYVVEIKPSDEHPARLFAAKVMDKSSRHRAAKARTELEILKMLDHPFLPRLHASVDSPTQLCLLTELCPAGNLNRLRQDQFLNRFPESAVRFYAAEVLVALEYLHMKGIVHRDLKPENILIRRDGHIVLNDFDISLICDGVVSTLVVPTGRRPGAKQHDWLIPSCFRPTMKHKPREKTKPAKPAKLKFAEFVAEPVDARSTSFVGTHEYMAPEVVGREGHGSAVDWWALGILIYEMCYGSTPFKGLDHHHTMVNIGVKALQFPAQPVVSAEAKDLMTQLLAKEPADRLGSTTGASAIKSHPFFRDMNWALLRSTNPPFVPHASVNNYCFGSDCSTITLANSSPSGISISTSCTSLAPANTSSSSSSFSSTRVNYY